jgi:hypothetical protein
MVQDPEKKYDFKGRIRVQNREVKLEKLKPVNIETTGSKPINACNLEEFIELTERKPRLLRMLVKTSVMDLVINGMRLVIVDRKNKKTISNIVKIKYANVEIQTGYHCFAPRLTAPILGVYESDKTDRIERNGVVLFLKPGDFVIKIGDIIKIDNI